MRFLLLVFLSVAFESSVSASCSPKVVDGKLIQCRVAPYKPYLPPCSAFSHDFALYFDRSSSALDNDEPYSQQVAAVLDTVKSVHSERTDRAPRCYLESITVDGFSLLEEVGELEFDLSLKRAQSVKDEFIERGFPRSIITTQAVVIQPFRTGTEETLHHRLVTHPRVEVEMTYREKQ